MEKDRPTGGSQGHTFSSSAWPGFSFPIPPASMVMGFLAEEVSYDHEQRNPQWNNAGLMTNLLTLPSLRKTNDLTSEDMFQCWFFSHASTWNRLIGAFTKGRPRFQSLLPLGLWKIINVDEPPFATLSSLIIPSKLPGAHFPFH